MTDEELIARLNNLFWMLKEDGHYTKANTASFAAARLDAQAAEIERLRDERERLALAICGGEDAPGYANAQTVETLEKVARDNANATMEQIDRIKSQAAEIETLRGEVARLRNAAAVVVVIHREARDFGAFRSTKFTTSLSLAVSDLKEALTGSATVKESLTTEDEKQSHEWKCPIDYPGCRKHCGSQYGCKN